MNTFFPSAAHDLLFLLDRGYPKTPAVDLVANRYRLGGMERMVLYRGIFDRGSASERKKKRVGLDTIISSPLHIDGFNVTITLESYLRGLFVFRATDGYVRDVSEFHGGYKTNDTTQHSVDLMAGSLLQRNAKTVFVLKSCMDACTDLVAMIERSIKRLRRDFEVKTEKNPDDLLLERSDTHAQAVVATADTEILDRADRAVDLVSLIVEKKLKKTVFDLERVLTDTGG
ncbi:MAG: DUF434 domain-containing protein [Spirochaetes bacterium]|nr:DUF434 domain-containing protein [Spirochaetota bacterium]